MGDHYCVLPQEAMPASNTQMRARVIAFGAAVGLAVCLLSVVGVYQVCGCV